MGTLRKETNKLKIQKTTMKFKNTFTYTLLAIALSWGNLSAQTEDESIGYKTISTLSYFQTEAGYYNIDSVTAGTTYYFNPRHTVGPLNQFAYISRDNFIRVSGSTSDYSYDPPRDHNNSTDLDLRVYGEFFIKNWHLGAGYSRYKVEYDSIDYENESHQLELDVGYFVRENLFLYVNNYIDADDGRSFHLLAARYEHKLNESDYLGISAATNEEFEYIQLNSKYFRKLSNGGYLVPTLSASFYEGGGTSFGTGVDYYFNKMTSIGGRWNDSNSVTIRVNHFFNQHFNLGASYRFNTSDSDTNYLNVNFGVSY